MLSRLIAKLRPTSASHEPVPCVILRGSEIVTALECCRAVDPTLVKCYGDVLALRYKLMGAMKDRWP